MPSRVRSCGDTAVGRRRHRTFNASTTCFFATEKTQKALRDFARSTNRSLLRRWQRGARKSRKPWLLHQEGASALRPPRKQRQACRWETFGTSASSRLLHANAQGIPRRSPRRCSPASSTHSPSLATRCSIPIWKRHHTRGGSTFGSTLHRDGCKPRLAPHDARTSWMSRAF